MLRTRTLADSVLQSGWIRFGFVHYSRFRVCGATDLSPYWADLIALLLSGRNFAARDHLLVVDSTLSKFQRAAKGKADQFHTGSRVGSPFMPPRSIWALDWHHVRRDSIPSHCSQV